MIMLGRGEGKESKDENIFVSHYGLNKSKLSSALSCHCHSVHALMRSKAIVSRGKCELNGF